MSLTTFIIPTLGRDSLQRAVDSVVKQAPFLIQKDVNKEGAGIIRSRLIEKAETEWVSMLDDDDTVTDDYVRRLQEESEAHPEADVIVFREYFMAHLMEEDVTEDHFIWNKPVIEWGQIGIAFSVKREVALKYPYRSEPYEDLHFVERIAEAGHKIHFSKYLVYRGRH